MVQSGFLRASLGVALAASILFSNAARADRAQAAFLKVCVYFDTVEKPQVYKLGDLYSIMLRNLLGHFEEVEAVPLEVAKYRSGALNSCDRAAYIGSDYFMKLPPAFLKDVTLYRRPFLWINYGIWQLQDLIGSSSFRARFGFNFKELTGFDDQKDSQGLPGFYRYFEYKGEQFQKYIKNDTVITNEILGSPEIGLLDVDGAHVISNAIHSVTHQSTPYIVEKNGFFYVADIPFSYIHENDRYLIFCDILFDWLQLPPRSAKHYALARIEDIHPAMPLDELYKSFTVFKRRRLPFALTLIPIYEDPVGYNTSIPAYVDMAHNPAFLKAIRYADANGGTILLHGVTHQENDKGVVNCFSDVTGDDFEFWDGCQQKPLAGDSAAMVMGKLNQAFQLLKITGLNPVGWVTPHYQASPIDYEVFGKVFSRTLQRMRYSPTEYDPSDMVNWAGQFFPYTIRKDVYGQFIWPEDLGNVQMFVNVTDGKRSPEEIIAAAKADRVLRDTWASFFWHPELIEADVGIHSLNEILDALQSFGYEFVSLKDLKAQGD